METFKYTLFLLLWANTLFLLTQIYYTWYPVCMCDNYEGLILRNGIEYNVIYGSTQIHFCKLKTNQTIENDFINICDINKTCVTDCVYKENSYTPLLLIMAIFLEIIFLSNLLYDKYFNPYNGYDTLP